MRQLPLTGVVLAGGASRRMGRDKARLVVDGQPLALRVAARLSPVCDEVLVASGDGRRLADLGLPQVADPIPGAGPLAGICAGLAAARHELVAVVAVDLPQADAALLARLAGLWTDQPAVVPRAGGRLQPLHAVWHRAALPALRARLDAGERRAVAAVTALGARVVDVGDLPAFRNLNRLEDLSAPAPPTSPARAARSGGSCP